MTISLAIPTYNSSKYFWDCIKTALMSDFISEIVVHDDNSEWSEYLNMFELSAKINTDKIKIYRATHNEKAFINKYMAVSKCTNEWVYLFDSDNWFDDPILEVISKLDLSKKDTCYHVKELHMTDGNIVKFDYENNSLDLPVAKENIKNSTNNIEWILNTGNFIVNKDTYLRSQADAVESLRNSDGRYKNPKGADVLLFSYCWYMHGNRYEPVDGFYHHHRIRPGNYFVEEMDYNMALVREYLDKILTL